jgi:hypothetical protein
LEHPSIIGVLIFIRTTIREKELGADEFQPHYDAAKQAIQEYLGIDYLQGWIEKTEVVEAQYTKKKPEPVDSNAQRKSSTDEAKEEFTKYFNDLWKRLTATTFDTIGEIEVK